jgi:hypothetical protein
LLGDSAYRLTNRVLKPYSKRAVQEDVTGHLAIFNIHFSSARVKVEHAYGFMKGRFPIISQIPIILGSVEGNREAVDIIFAICTLHNFLLSLQEDWELSEEDLRRTHDEMMDAYYSIMDSQWKAELDRTHERISARRQMWLGMLKREWLTGQILNWLEYRNRLI